MLGVTVTMSRFIRNMTSVLSLCAHCVQYYLEINKIQQMYSQRVKDSIKVGLDFRVNLQCVSILS